jgi:uncharacterized protein YkwD
MGRRIAALTVLAVGALAVAGCGSAPSISGPSGAEANASMSVETTDGRLGGAVVVRQGRAPHTLARGGRLDVRERGASERRDGVGAGASCPVVPDVSSIPAAADATLCLLNGERADRGLPPLAADAQLAAAASAYAGDLVAGSYFSHTGRDGSDLVDRIRATGYMDGDRPWHVGENLAWGTGGLAAPGAIVQAWMNSPGHRENILSPAFREIGVGIVAGNPAAADGAGATYVTEFGTLEQPAAGGGGSAARPAAQAAASRKAGKRRAAKRKPARSAKHRSAGKKRKGKRRVKASGGPIAHIAM